MRILYLPNYYSQQRQKEKKRFIYPVRLAMEAEYYRQGGHEVYWGDIAYINYYPDVDLVIEEPENLPFLELPIPDRVWTRAKDYTSGNYKHLPGTHILSASGCWWGNCTFCVESKRKSYAVRTVDNVLEEIEQCYKLGFREVFDDAATLKTGRWLDDLCKGLKKIPISFSANFRAIDYDYVRLREAGVRMLLFGIESANQTTLERINKGITADSIKYIIKAALAGIECHICVIFGYPWETDEDAKRTLRLVHYLLRKGYAKTAQASFYQPPDKMNNPSHKKYIKKIYNIGFHPEFWVNQLRSIKNKDDIKYIWRGIKEAFK